MKHRAKQRKPVTPPRKKRVTGVLKEGERVCDHCGAKFNLSPSSGQTTYTVPAFWDGVDDTTAPTVYFDKPECYTAWVAAHRPRPIRSQPDRRPPEPKNTAPMDSMFDQPSDGSGSQA